MRVEPVTVTLRDGRRAVLRSPEVAEAGRLLENIRATSGETHFMAREADEVTRTPAEQGELVRQALADEDAFMVAAFIDGELVGNASVARVSDLRKMRHRGQFGISLLQKACGLGLGTALLDRVLCVARTTAFEQLELGVLADNARARHVYEKAGFMEVGVVPRAFKLADGTYRDEVLMARTL